MDESYVIDYKNNGCFLYRLGTLMSKNNIIATTRSEERRVGKECRSRWSPYH